MNKFLQTLSSSHGVITITLILLATLFLPIIVRPLFYLQNPIFLAFFVFVIYSLFKTHLASTGWKIYLWVVLVPIVGVVVTEIVQWFLYPDLRVGIGWLSTFALMFGLPLLLIGLYGLFKSSEKRAAIFNLGSNIVH